MSHSIGILRETDENSIFSTVSSLVRLAVCLPIGNGPDAGLFGTYKYVITALLNYNISAYSSIFFAPLSPASAPVIPPLPNSSPMMPMPSLPPLPARLLALLDETTRLYTSYRPHDVETGKTNFCAPETLDECLSYLLLLLTKCAIQDDSGDVRKAMRTCLLAEDM